MSGVYQSAVVAKATLWCNAHACGRSWSSDEYTVLGWDDRNRAAEPAFAAGWRVFIGARQQYTYCPEHGPTVAMGQLHPAGAR